MPENRKLKTENPRIGLSGYSYKPWQGEGRFYPIGLKQREFLPFYAERYNAVEMDGTWYRMPGEEQVQNWLANTPDDFKFCFKLHRDITHIKRLKPESHESLKFMLGRLKPVLDAGKMGPLLVQLPPNLKADVPRLDAFLAEAPKGHRYAVEFRNDTWHTKDTEEVLRRHSAAWAAIETDEAEAQWRQTADFTYCRLRKAEYTNDELDAWTRRLAAFEGEAFAFCKHEDEGAPWVWADYLNATLGLDK